MIATLEQEESLQHANSRAVVASLESVSMNYGEVRALRNVNFTVRSGQVVALLGPNGAGKTTAVKLLLGLLQPNSGKARVFAGDPTHPQNRMRTGAMLQVGKVPETLRVREHIDLFSSYYPQAMPLEEVLAAAGLEKLPWPSAAIPTCCSWMNPPSDSTSKPAAHSGKKFAGWSITGKPFSSPRTI
jgi:ABC-2 type transport system ATP-binding protein